MKTTEEYRELLRRTELQCQDAEALADYYSSVLQELHKGLERFDPYAYYAEASEILNRQEF